MLVRSVVSIRNHFSTVCHTQQYTQWPILGPIPSLILGNIGDARGYKKSSRFSAVKKLKKPTQKERLAKFKQNVRAEQLASGAREPPRRPNQCRIPSRLPIRFGSVIHIFHQVRTGQTVYSLYSQMDNTRALNQLTFVGKKSVPEALRRDVWERLATVTYTEKNMGLRTYQRLTEYRKLHETRYPTRVLRRTTREQRMKRLMNQKPNAIADLARVIEMDESKSPVRIKWGNIYDAEFAYSWTKNVTHVMEPHLNDRNGRRALLDRIDPLDLKKEKKAKKKKVKKMEEEGMEKMTKEGGEKVTETADGRSEPQSEMVSEVSPERKQDKKVEEHAEKTVEDKDKSVGEEASEKVQTVEEKSKGEAFDTKKS